VVAQAERERRPQQVLREHAGGVSWRRRVFVLRYAHQGDWYRDRRRANGSEARFRRRRCKLVTRGLVRSCRLLRTQQPSTAEGARGDAGACGRSDRADRPRVLGGILDNCCASERARTDRCRQGGRRRRYCRTYVQRSACQSATWSGRLQSQRPSARRLLSRHALEGAAAKVDRPNARSALPCRVRERVTFLPLRARRRAVGACWPQTGSSLSRPAK